MILHDFNVILNWSILLLNITNNITQYYIANITYKSLHTINHTILHNIICHMYIGQYYLKFSTLLLNIRLGLSILPNLAILYNIEQQTKFNILLHIG